jgi:LmbE family N-acetylglucosaminyl deacetylase
LNPVTVFRLVTCNPELGTRNSLHSALNTLEPLLADDAMLKFQLGIGKNQPLQILCLGAHSDDIEIGCGGTILKLVEEHKNVEVHWVVFGANGQRRIEATKSATLFSNEAKRKKVVINNFKDGFFPYIGKEIKTFFEKLKKRVSPDIIFTHYRNDLHQDHRLISELTWNTYRDHLILEYEIPKYDGDLGSPNFFVHLSTSPCEKKVDYILKSFRSQRENHWFTRETFFSILRLRGIESNAPEKYAEGFYCRKMVF